MSRKSHHGAGTSRADLPATTGQQRMVGKSPVPDFLDSALEWRRLFAESLGTFLLVLVAAGASAVTARTGSPVSPTALAIAPGVTVMVIIYAMGAVSGVRLNPAVTLAFALRRNFPWCRVPGYLLAQLLGGAAAALFLRAMFGTVGALGATLPGADVGTARVLFMETPLTAGLVNVILGAVSGARNIGTNGTIAVGGVHRSCWHSGGTGQWRRDEPRASVLSGPGPREPCHNLDLRGRAARRGRSWCRPGMDSQRPADRCRSDCRTRHVRYQGPIDSREVAPVLGPGPASSRRPVGLQSIPSPIINPQSRAGQDRGLNKPYGPRYSGQSAFRRRG
jgi:aquaporin Z